MKDKLIQRTVIRWGGSVLKEGRDNDYIQWGNKLLLAGEWLHWRSLEVRDLVETYDQEEGRYRLTEKKTIYNDESSDRDIKLLPRKDCMKEDIPRQIFGRYDPEYVCYVDLI